MLMIVRQEKMQMSWIHQTEPLCVRFWRRLRLDWMNRCKNEMTVTYVWSCNDALSHCVNISPAGCGLLICNESARKLRRSSQERQEFNQMQTGKRRGCVSPVLRCWLGLLGCMVPWQTGGCTAPSGGITPVRAKNWLMDEHRSAIWVGSRDQLFSSACLILSLSPWKNKNKKKNKERVSDVISLRWNTFVTMKCMTDCPKTNLQTCRGKTLVALNTHYFSKLWWVIFKNTLPCNPRL